MYQESSPLGRLKFALDEQPLTVAPHMTVLDVVTQMAAGDRYSSVSPSSAPYALVVEKSQLLGWFTAEDLLSLVAGQQPLDRLQIGEVVIPPPLTLPIAEVSEIASVLAVFQRYPIAYLTLTDERGNFLGIIRRDRLDHWFCPKPQPAAINPQDSPLAPALSDVFTERTAALLQTSDEFIAEIVQRHHAEAQLFRTTAELQAIVQAFPDLYFQVEADGTIIDYHIGQTDDLYVPPETFLYRRIEEVLPPEVSQQFTVAIAQVLQNQALTAVEYSLVMQGQIKYFEARVIAFLQTRVLVIVRDISDRKRAEAALRRSEATQRVLLDTIPDLMIRMTHEGNYLDFLPAKDFRMVMPTLEMVGQNIYDIMPLEIAQQRMRYIQQALQTGETQVYEYELIIDGQMQMEEARITTSGENEVLVIVRDITARKQAEKALQAQQEFLRHVIDTVPNLIFVKDGQGRFTLVNQALARMYGSTIENLIGKTDADFNPNLIEVEQFLQEDQRVIALKQEKLIPEETVTDSNGNTYWFQTIKKPLFTSDAQAYHVLGIATDITRRKQAEADLQALNEALELKVHERTQALQRANDQLRIEIAERQQSDAALRLFDRAIKASSNGIVITDAQLPSMPITYVNPAFERITGYSAAEALGRNCQFLQGIDTDPNAIAQIRTALRERHDCTVVLRNYRKDGCAFWNELSIAPIYDYKGELTHFVGVQTDISERRKIEEALQQQLAAIEAATDGISISNSKHKFVYLNNAHVKLFGYQNADELIGQTWHKLYSEAESKRLEQAIYPALKQNQSWHGEAIAQRQDGSCFPQEFSLTFLANGDLVCVGRDITERKQAEDQIRASLKEKEVLIKEIHHRVKNNLQVISSLLRLQAGYIQNAQALEIFQESQNRVKAMALLHEKLYQSKDLANINFTEYVEGLINNLFRSYGARSRGITVNLQIEAIAVNLDAVIPCGLIINELVSNSLKYAFPENRSGIITVEVCSCPNGIYELTVSDDGIGIVPGIDIQNTQSLGLQLVHLLTEQLEGSIRLERSCGTSFKITLDTLNFIGKESLNDH